MSSPFNDKNNIPYADSPAPIELTSSSSSSAAYPRARASPSSAASKRSNTGQLVAMESGAAAAGKQLPHEQEQRRGKGQEEYYEDEVDEAGHGSPYFKSILIPSPSISSSPAPLIIASSTPPSASTASKPTKFTVRRIGSVLLVLLTLFLVGTVLVLGTVWKYFHVESSAVIRIEELKIGSYASFLGGAAAADSSNTNADNAAQAAQVVPPVDEEKLAPLRDGHLEEFAGQAAGQAAATAAAAASSPVSQPSEAAADSAADPAAQPKYKFTHVAAWWNSLLGRPASTQEEEGRELGRDPAASAVKGKYQNSPHDDAFAGAGKQVFSNLNGTKAGSGSDFQVQEQVPRIIHQTWKTDVLPDKWAGIAEECKRIHPDYEYMLWTDQSSRAFIKEHYSWFLPYYDGYPYPIQRADAIRYFVLYHYGGVYMDLDIGCRKRIDPLLRFEVILPETIPVGISNDLMFSAKKHPFLEQVIRNLIPFDHQYISHYPTVMFSTGPMFLSASLRIWLDEHGIPQPSTPEFPQRGLHGVRVLPKSLYGKNLPEELSGEAFFRHFYGSSWHAGDADFIIFLRDGGKWLFVFGAIVACIGLLKRLGISIVPASVLRVLTYIIPPPVLRVMGRVAALLVRGVVKVVGSGNGSTGASAAYAPIPASPAEGEQLDYLPQHSRSRSGSAGAVGATSSSSSAIANAATSARARNGPGETEAGILSTIWDAVSTAGANIAKGRKSSSRSRSGKRRRKARRSQSEFPYAANAEKYAYPGASSGPISSASSSSSSMMMELATRRDSLGKSGRRGSGFAAVYGNSEVRPHTASPHVMGTATAVASSSAAGAGHSKWHHQHQAQHRANSLGFIEAQQYNQPQQLSHADLVESWRAGVAGEQPEIVDEDAALRYANEAGARSADDERLRPTTGRQYSMPPFRGPKTPDIIIR